MRTRTVMGGAAALALIAALAGCDQRLAAQPARDHQGLAEAGTPAGGAAAVETIAPSRSSGSYAAGRGQAAEAATPVRLIEGRPMWSDNRRHSAEENAEYQFERHGKELGAASLDDFVVKAHHFLNTPPEGTKSLTRANGDKLLFDPKSKLFGVVRSDGAPRTVFKPDEGQAYWDQQVASQGDDRAATPRRRTAARSEGDDRS